jgi:hypothetical protein
VIHFAPTIGFAGLPSFSSEADGARGYWTGAMQPIGKLGKVPELRTWPEAWEGEMMPRARFFFLSHVQLFVLPDGRIGRAHYNRF